MWPKAYLSTSVFRSKQFVFVVGENQTAFTVHSAIIAKQSKALDVLINGSMREASEGKAVFEDIEEDTFIRFCQFAYTRDYTTPGFTHVPSIELLDISPPDALSYVASSTDRDNSIEPAPVPAPIDDFGWRSATPKKPSKSSLLRQSLHDQHYNIETIRGILATRCEVRQNSDPIEDYTTVFLGHAQLYVFAEKWGIESLRTLALLKLRKALTSFTLYTARRPGMVELLRYTFNYTPDLVDAVDDLRSLVILYTACEVENLIHCPEFLSLISEGGQLAQNLVQMLMNRIS